eukprot:GHVT01088632.1.p4 GENE.GHVT01088632.1~~GHVT01088632.1.p4  ORF type:complete len:321 (+),score=13.69 GHVT01088632.1:4042-5004(+)
MQIFFEPEGRFLHLRNPSHARTTAKSAVYRFNIPFCICPCGGITDCNCGFSHTSLRRKYCPSSSEEPLRFVVCLTEHKTEGSTSRCDIGGLSTNDLGYMAAEKMATESDMRPDTYSKLCRGHRHLIRRQVYTLADVAEHCHSTDCWVILHGQVLDMTLLLTSHQADGAQELAEVAGTDVSHWFDRDTHLPKVDVPFSSVVTENGQHWWEDSSLICGRVSSIEQRIRLFNTLTQQTTELVVPSEDTLEQIQERYAIENAHAEAYIWKWLGKPLDLKKTLVENGVVDERVNRLVGNKAQIFSEDALTVPVIHLYFADDLRSI